MPARATGRVPSPPGIASQTRFDTESCARRNRLAARRDAVNATPWHFLTEGRREQLYRQPGFATKQARAEADLATRFGEIGADVYVHYMEAASDRFIGDRFMFLHPSTLQNAAKDADAGIAFMNSHRTGGLSHPAELPFGHSFLGHYEETDNGGLLTRRSLMGVFMRPGLSPAGANGPTTDDMHALIESGTIGDVSVGLWGGQAICDVCGEDIDAYDRETGFLCPHWPGSTDAMTPAEQKAQVARGVEDGSATYSLVNAHCAEVSAVYDGAIPGAGFQKFSRLSREGHLSRPSLSRGAIVYAPFLTDHERRLLLTGGAEDTSMPEHESQSLLAAIREGFANLAGSLRPTQPAAAADPAFEPVKLLPEHVPALPSPDLAAQSESTTGQRPELLSEIEALRAQLAEASLQTHRAEAQKAVAAFKIAPSQLEAAARLRAADPDAFDRLMAAQPVRSDLAPKPLTVSGEEAVAARLENPPADLDPAQVYARRRDETLAYRNGAKN